jgi:MFS family permease
MQAQTSLRLLPLFTITAAGMLTVDLYLPAVPTLPADLGGTIVQAQATLAVFFATLAASQIVWGSAADKFGVKPVLIVAITLQIAAGFVCAVAPSVETLIAARGVQGFGVGAAVVPALIRRNLDEAASVRAMALLATGESMIPAIAPILGALLLLIADWRASFWIVALLTIAATPFALRAIPPAPPVSRETRKAAGGYGALLRDRVYFGYALGHGLCFGALLVFVASAPQIIELWLGGSPRDFAILQCCGVLAFSVAASQNGRLTQRFSLDTMIASGVIVQIVATVALLALAWVDYKSFVALGIVWMMFCGALGLRGPSTMARALSVDKAIVGRASGLLMFMGLGLSAAGTQAVAPFLDHGLMPVALTALAFTLASAALVLNANRNR